MNIKKSMVSLLVAATLAGTSSAPVSAAPISTVEAGTEITAYQGNLNSEPISYGKPISESTYTDKDGVEVTEKIYFVPTKPRNGMSNSIETFDFKKATISGEGWYKKEKVQKWSAGETRYWVKGYFVWGNGESKLKNPQYYYTNTGRGVKIKDISKKKTNNSLTLSFKATTSFGMTQKLSVSLTVDSKGRAK